MGHKRKGGIVSAGHPATASAGLEILELGGNAVDAAIAASFTSFVAEPMLTDVGGGGYMLSSGANGDLVYDFFTRTPGLGGNFSAPPGDFHATEVDYQGATQIFHVGIGASGIPGVIHGLCTAHSREGRLPLAQVMAPAIRTARQGVQITPELATVIKIIGPIFLRDPTLAAIVAPNGTYLKPGEHFRWSHVAPLLEQVSREGLDCFYRGDIAKAIVETSQERGGHITLQDLDAYETRMTAPIERTIANHRLLATGPPATGGALVSFCLQLCDGLTHPADASSPEGLAMMAGAMYVSNLARAVHVDPFVGGEYTTDTLHDPAIKQRYQDALREQLKSQSLALPPAEDRRVAGNTTHISVVDPDGHAVALTTSNGEGSGVLVPGAGIHMNNMLGEEDLNPRGFHAYPPGHFLPSMMNPMILESPEGKRLVMGSGGANRIRSALFQTAYRMLFSGETLSEAVLAPRLHLEGQTVQAENGLPEASYQHLRDTGFDVQVWETTNLYFGGVNAVTQNQNGEREGQGDPRRGGCVAAPETPNGHDSGFSDFGSEG